MLFGNSASAGTCKDIVGVWHVTGEEVCGTKETLNFEYRSIDWTFEITNQNGCLFYGDLGSLSPGNIITGSMIKSRITMTAWDATFIGNVRGNSRIDFSFSDIADDESTEQCTGNASAVRM